VATEKLYGDYQVLATNPGGHSSLPKPDNAIYHVADALGALERSPFPFELNSVTREYFAQMAATESGPTAADIRAMLATPPDAAAVARLSENTRYNATLRTTCVATLMSAGHAPNALPQRADAQRQLPNLPRAFAGRDSPEVGGVIQRPGAHGSLPRRWRRAIGSRLGSQGDGAPASACRCHGFFAQRGRKVLAGCGRGPDHDDVGIGQRPYMVAGIPSYGVSGVAVDRNDVRMHGKDERVSVESYDTGVEFYYDFLKKLTTRN